MRDSMRQLDPAARNPWMIATTHFQRRIGGYRLPRFDQLGFTRIDVAGQNERLRAGAAFGKPRSTSI